MIPLGVYRIHDPSCPMSSCELGSTRIGTYRYHVTRGKAGKPKSCRVGDLKSWVARDTGVPPERQVYHCIFWCLHPNGVVYDFDPSSALPTNYDYLALKLAKYEKDGRSFNRGKRDGRIFKSDIIAVRFLPESREATDDDDDGDIQVVREANALEESIARGRANAVEVPESDEEDDDEDERPPQAKRPRTAATRSGGAEEGEGKSDAEGEDRKLAAAWREGGDDTAAEDSGDDIGPTDGTDPGNGENEPGDGEDGEATAPEAVSGNRDGAAVQGDGNQHEGGGDDEDAGGDEEAVGEEYSDGAAAAAHVNTALGSDQASPPPGSALRRWLRDLDTTGEGGGRYEAFAPAFEREFHSLRDLALAADQARRKSLRPAGWNGTATGPV